MNDAEKIEIEIESGLFTEFGQTFLYCPNAFEVWRSGKVLCLSESRIVALSASWIFQIFVFATSDHKVHFHCARKGTEITAPTEINDVIRRILITEKCGFVIMHSDQMIYLYNVNGCKIKNVPLPAPILLWSTFSSYYSLDYIICTIGLQQIALFDVFYPEHMEIVCQSSDVILIHFDPTSDRIFYLTITQDFVVIPYKLPATLGPSRRRAL
jgi:hypothetical protein